jgi:hypothetical protein
MNKEKLEEGFMLKNSMETIKIWREKLEYINKDDDSRRYFHEKYPFIKKVFATLKFKINNEQIRVDPNHISDVIIDTTFTNQKLTVKRLFEMREKVMKIILEDLESLEKELEQEFEKL